MDLLHSLNPGNEAELGDLTKEDCLEMAEDVDSLTPQDKEEHVLARELLDIRYNLNSKGIKYNWTMEIMPFVSNLIENCYTRIANAAANDLSDTDSAFSKEEAKELNRQLRRAHGKEASKIRNRKNKSKPKRGPGRPKGSKNKIKYN